MAPLDFEILSKLMRYVFTFLGVLIVWRTYTWLARDRRETHKRVKALPDAGFIGILTVLRGSTELAAGEVIPVPWEGVLGFVRTCDIVVPVTDVVAQHLDFTFRNGKGLYIYPRRGCPAAVDSVTIDSRADSRRYPMRHGSILQVGDALLQLGVFAGLEVEQVTSLSEPLPADEDEAVELPSHVIQGQTGSYFQPGPYAPPYPPQNGMYAPNPYVQGPFAPGAYPPPPEEAQSPQGNMYVPNPYAPPPDEASLPVMTPPERRPGDEA